MYALAITKQGLDENGKNTGPLNGVEFKLEKLKDDNSVDATFNENAGSMTKITADDGANAGKCSFKNLSAGSYRLTELKTVDGYNLLAAPIEFVFERRQMPDKKYVARKYGYRQPRRRLHGEFDHQQPQGLYAAAHRRGRPPACGC